MKSEVLSERFPEFEPAEHAVIRGHGDKTYPELRRYGAPRRTKPFDKALSMFGRAIFGGYFLYNGINHFKNGASMAEYARGKQVPSPELAVSTSGALIVLGGLSVLSGYRPRLGASLIAAFLLGVSPKMHAFWDIEDEQQRAGEFVHFAKNVALLGAAAVVAAER